MSSYNPLLTPEVYAERYHREGFVDPVRCSGRTTSIALRSIADAIDNPGVPQDLKDHHGSLRSDGDLSAKVDYMLSRLGLNKHTQVVRISKGKGYAVLFGVDLTGRAVDKKEQPHPPAPPFVL